METRREGEREPFQKKLMAERSRLLQTCSLRKVCRKTSITTYAKHLLSSAIWSYQNWSELISSIRVDHSRLELIRIDQSWSIIIVNIDITAFTLHALKVHLIFDIELCTTWLIDITNIELFYRLLFSLYTYRSWNSSRRQKQTSRILVKSTSYLLMRSLRYLL